MQKKLIALAVSALVSGAAFAQSTVTIYGVADGGISYRTDGPKNSHDRITIDTGISAGNRLGFKGVEDLGNGISALYTVEMGFGADDGALRNGVGVGKRQAFLGLTGGFGTVIAGRLYTPHYTLLSSIDPFKAGTVGSYRNVSADVVSLNALTGNDDAVGNVFDPTRVDNTIAYVSPSAGGFNVTVAYSNGASGRESLGTKNTDDIKVFVLQPRYTQGIVDVGINFHQINVEGRNNLIGGGVGVDDITNIAVAAALDFGAIKIHAFYDTNTLTFTSPPGVKYKDWTMDTFLFGLTFPFAGKNAIQLSGVYNKMDNGRDTGEVTQAAIGYTYELSKRTNFYVAAATITQDDKAKNKVFQRAASVGDNSNNYAGYETGVQFGLKHTF